MIGNNLSFLLGIFNSKLGEWMFNKIGTTTGVGTNRWKKYKLEEFYVKIANNDEILTISSSVNQLLKLGTSYDKLNTLNQYIYNIYKLTEEESRFINSYQKV